MSNVPSIAAKPKRRWLTFSLRTFLVVTLVLSVTLGYFGRVWFKAYRDRQPPTVYELSEIAQRVELRVPAPPPAAKLVLARRGVQSVGQRYIPMYWPAFLLEESENGDILVLCGEEEIPLSHAGDVPAGSGPPLCREFSLDDAQASQTGFVTSGPEPSTLISVLQLANRGDHARAKQLLQRLEAAPPGGESPDLRELLRQAAYAQLEGELHSQPAQWPKLRRRLAILLEESEPLRRDKADLLQDLTATVVAPAPPPNSTEALLLAWSRSDELKSPCAEEVVCRGFDAVPDLIRLREDRRVTVHWRYDESFNNVTGFRRVGDLADDLLRSISGFELGEGLSVAMPDELSELDAAAWDAWWQQARAQGEREYCVKNVFSAAPLKFRVRQGLVGILAQKYPDTLLHVGELWLREWANPIPSHQLAEAIAGLHLPEAVRTEMLANLAQQGTHVDQRGALRVLARFDPQRTAELLAKLLDQLPATATGFDGPVSEGIPILVVQLEQLPLTRAYLQAARRNVRLKMDLVSRLVYWFAKESHRPTRLALLAAFLDDETPRDRSLHSESFFSDDFAGITIRDFVTLQLAKLLNMDAAADQSWSPEQWSALREQVRDRLQQEELPKLE